MLLLGVLLSLALPLAARADGGAQVRWWGLLTEDADKASAFYRDLFGLEMTERGPGRAGWTGPARWVFVAQGLAVSIVDRVVLSSAWEKK